MSKEDEIDLLHFKELTKKLLDGTYIKTLYNEVSQKECIFDAFCDKMENNFKQCKAELKIARKKMFISSGTKRKLAILQSEAEKRKGNRIESLVERYRTELSKVSYMPSLNVKGKFTQCVDGKFPLIEIEYGRIDPDISDSDIDIDVSDSEEEVANSDGHNERLTSFQFHAVKAVSDDSEVESEIEQDENGENKTTRRIKIETTPRDSKTVKIDRTMMTDASEAIQNRTYAFNVSQGSDETRDSKTEKIQETFNPSKESKTVMTGASAAMQNHTGPFSVSQGSDETLKENTETIVSGLKRNQSHTTNVKEENANPQETENFEVSGTRLKDINKKCPPLSKSEPDLKTLKRSITRLKIDGVSHCGEKIYQYHELKNRLADVNDLKQLFESNEKQETTSYEAAFIKAKVAAPNVKVLDDGDIELLTCTDLKLFDDYIIAVSDGKVMKFDNRNHSVIDTLTLQRAGRICSIRNSDCVGIIQTNTFLAVVRTKGKLSVLYKLRTTKPYIDVCHICTYSETARGLPSTNFSFGALYSERSTSSESSYTDKIDIIRCEFGTGGNKVIQEYDTRAVTIELLKYGITGSSSLSSFSANKIVLCGNTKVTCLARYGISYRKEWQVHVGKAATDVVCANSFAYICVQDEERIMLVNADGRVENENILQWGIFKGRPDKMSVSGDTILVKAFDDTRWKSLLTAKPNKASDKKS